MALFTIKDLSFWYPEQKKPALDNVSLTIRQGEFVVLCGKSGCGKSTLLRHLKTDLTPHGQRTGEILFEERPLCDVPRRDQSAKIGFVLQSPEHQIVTDKVWHELAFGLESLGCAQQTIRLRVAEMASFFGIQEWFLKSVTELSGGQKQLLNLASIMAMQPVCLVLDEPTSQLDPIAASDFLATLKKINTELGTTVILSEHRLEEAFPLADRAVVMQQGEILCADAPRAAAQRLKSENNDLFCAMPAPMQIYAGVENTESCPITVREGRAWLDRVCPEVKQDRLEYPCRTRSTEEVITAKDVWFRYEKNGRDIVKDLNLSVRKGELYCILGGNGTGKTTTLGLLNGILRPYRGKICLNGKPISRYADRELFCDFLGVLPQNPQSLFVKKTVEEDLYEMLAGKGLSKHEKMRRVVEIAQKTEILELLFMHPYDLSGGEQQRAALAKVLLTNPRILLMDEPTKGMDGFFKIKLAGVLQKLRQDGTTILMVSHDIEFCAEYADVCALFFNGGIVSADEPRRFFSGNSFYTTAANRMARHKFPGAVCREDVIELCNQNRNSI